MRVASSSEAIEEEASEEDDEEGDAVLPNSRQWERMGLKGREIERAEKKAEAEEEKDEESSEEEESTSAPERLSANKNAHNMFWQILEILGVAGTKEVRPEVAAFILRQPPEVRRGFLAGSVVTDGWGPSKAMREKGAVWLGFMQGLSHLADGTSHKSYLKLVRDVARSLGLRATIFNVWMPPNGLVKGWNAGGYMRISGKDVHLIRPPAERKILDRDKVMHNNYSVRVWPPEEDSLELEMVKLKVAGDEGPLEASFLVG